MLYEYNNVMTAVQAVLDKQVGLAGNLAADDIDLAGVVSSADNLANACFGGNQAFIPATMVSRREAFDFVQAQSRLSDVFGKDRAAVYSEAQNEFAADKRRLQYLDAVLRAFDRYGG